MEGKWFSSVDTWETCASFTHDVFGDLMDYMSHSGFREKRSMVVSTCVLLILES